VAVEFVQSADRHLKWQALDGLERLLMVCCGVCLAGFSATVLADVVTREIGHPWLWLQEVTSAWFTYGTFCGTAVATRRNDHLQLSALTEAMRGGARMFFEVLVRGVVLLVGLAMAVFGWQNFLSGFHSFRMPSMTPIAYLYWPIPVCGAMVALFSLEQIVNGLRHGFERDTVGPTAEALEAVP
jgi:TRAP-type C4-dicarboxylate transport system permease small subunit